MEENLYYIHWKSPKTGAEGRGNKKFPKKQAEELCERLNKQDENIPLIHWISLAKEGEE